MGRANALLSSHLLLWSDVREGPSRLPLLISWASLLCPQDQCGCMGVEGRALEGRGLAWELSRFPCPQWAGQSPSALLLLPLDGPSCLPLLISPASLLCLQDPRGLDGALDEGNRLESSAGSAARVGQVIALCSLPTLPGEPLLPASPDLPGLRGTDLVWPPLLSPWSPYVLLVHSGVPPVSLGVRVPHQQPAGALVVGRC